MRKLFVVPILCGILAVSGIALAEGVKAGEMRALTKDEMAKAVAKAPTLPTDKNTWVVDLVRPGEAISFPGLPADKAFNRATLIFRAGAEDAKVTGVEANFWWPDGSKNPDTGKWRTTEKCEAVHYTENQQDLWLVDVEDQVKGLEDGKLHFNFKLTGGSREWINDLTAQTFENGSGWGSVQGGGFKFIVRERTKGAAIGLAKE